MDDMTTAFGRCLAELGARREDVVVLDADLNSSTKTMFFMERFPERFVQVGIAEQNLIGIASGLSLAEDLVPFAVTFAAFAARRTCDQAAIAVAYQKANVKIVGTYAGISLGKGGATHQSVEDIAIMRSMPGMRVADPGWPAEIGQVISAAAAYRGGVYVRIAAGVYPDLGNTEVFEWGRARVFRSGRDATLVTTGVMVHRALAAAEELERRGIAAGVLHCPCIEPLDEAALRECAVASRVLVTLENHGTAGGLGDAVCEAVAGTCPVRVLRLGVHRSYGQTARGGEELFRKHGLGVPQIVAAAQRALEGGGEGSFGRSAPRTGGVG